MTTLSNIEKLALTADINDKIVDSSTIQDEKTKQAFKNYSKYIKDYLKKEPEMNLYGVNSLKSGLLTYWNESINPDTEKFWTEVRANGIDYERKEPLKFALDKKRFRRVDQGIDARKHWTELKKLNEIQQRFTKTEISEIDDIILKDENQRIEILKKCLRKKQIPQTQYLKFGECMAYANNCGLWDKYFSKSEVDELYDIWKNFKSK
jgi:hypothetical protein